MAITAGIDDSGRLVVVDDSEGILGPPLRVPDKLTVTEFERGRFTVADNATAAAVPFGGVATAKVLSIRNRTAQEVMLNLTDAAGTVEIRFREFVCLYNADGRWTSATIDNDVEGTSAVDLETFVGG